MRDTEIIHYITNPEKSKAPNPALVCSNHYWLSIQTKKAHLHSADGQNPLWNGTHTKFFRKLSSLLIISTDVLSNQI